MYNLRSQSGVTLFLDIDSASLLSEDYLRLCSHHLSANKLTPHCSILAGRHTAVEFGSSKKHTTHIRYDIVRNDGPSSLVENFTNTS